MGYLEIPYTKWEYEWEEREKNRLCTLLEAFLEEYILEVQDTDTLDMIKNKFNVEIYKRRVLKW